MWYRTPGVPLRDNYEDRRVELFRYAYGGIRLYALDRTISADPRSSGAPKWINIAPLLFADKTACSRARLGSEQ
jgi:hypothetical protein